MLYLEQAPKTSTTFDMVIKQYYKRKTELKKFEYTSSRLETK